jgi:hypothetical protein
VPRERHRSDKSFGSCSPVAHQTVVIHDPQDDFPEGDYELIVGAQTFRFFKRNDEYLGIP